MSEDKIIRYPLLTLESFRKKMNKRAIKLDVNRSWLTILFVDYAFRNMKDSDIKLAARLDPSSAKSNKGFNHD